MTNRSKLAVWISAPLILIGVSTVSGIAGIKLSRQMLLNEMCCQVPARRNLVISMEGRTCQVFKEVVFSEAGKRVAFRVPGDLDLGGIVDTLGRWKETTGAARTEEFTTVTLGDILERAKAPRFIH